MKKLLFLFLLAVAGHLAYHQATLSGPVDAYEKFADAWARGNTAEALRFAKGDAVARALAGKPLAGLMQAGTMGAIRGTTYAILSTTESQDGDVLVQADQAIAFDPPGATAAAPRCPLPSSNRPPSARRRPAGRSSPSTPFFSSSEKPPGVRSRPR